MADAPESLFQKAANKFIHMRQTLLSFETISYALQVLTLR